MQKKGIEFHTPVEQLVFVTTEGWDSSSGQLFLYQKQGDNWERHLSAFSVMLGEHGLGWGVGVHGAPLFPGPEKREGDKKSPAGVFSLGAVFGYGEDYPPQGLKMESLPFISERVAVDDPQSSHYNTFATPPGDWKSSEPMTHPLYRLGMVIGHNSPNPTGGKGSCIFFHVWESGSTPTAGCTGMKEEELRSVLLWLDPAKNPHLVQLPLLPK